MNAERRLIEDTYQHAEGSRWLTVAIHQRTKGTVYVQNVFT